MKEHRRHAFRRSLLGLVLASALAFSTAGRAETEATSVALGQEFAISTATYAANRNVVSAFTPDGTALVVWENERTGLRARYLDKDGNQVSSELDLVENRRFAEFPSEGEEVVHSAPALAVLPTGGFLVTWLQARDYVRQFYFIENREPLERHVMVQAFDPSGAPVTKPTRLDRFNGLQGPPTIHPRHDGGAAVVWEGKDFPASGEPVEGLFLSLLDFAGRPIDAEAQAIRVDTEENPLGSTARNPAIAVGEGDDLIVAWEQASGTSLEIYSRAFDKKGVPKGDPFQLNDVTLGRQRRPGLTVDKSGNLLALWQSQLADPTQARVVGRFFAWDGTPLGDSFTISRGYGNFQIAPVARQISESRFIAAWIDYDLQFPLGLAGVEIDSSGAVLGDEFWISDGGIQFQYRTSLASDGEGNLLAPFAGFVENRPGIRARVLKAN